MESKSFNITGQKLENYGGQGKTNSDTYIENKRKYNITRGNDKRNIFYNYNQKPCRTIEKYYKIH